MRKEEIVQIVSEAHLKRQKLLESGYAGVDKLGRIVDRREFPDAYTVPKNSVFGIPEPNSLNSKEERITDKFLDKNFEQYDTGYWLIGQNTVISCEGHVYAESCYNTLTHYAEVNNMNELKMLLKVLKVEISDLSSPLNSDEELNNILP